MVCEHLCACSISPPYEVLQYVKFEIWNRDVGDFQLDQISFYMYGHIQKRHLYFWTISFSLKNTGGQMRIHHKEKKIF